MERFRASRAHLPRKRPVMPTFNFGPREELTELRPRHLLMVEEHGFEEHGYDRDYLREYFTVNSYRLFGPLRKSKALEMPSDQFRKELMITGLLNLIEMRREEYAEERVAISPLKNKAARRRLSSSHGLVG
jgi:hypothetical protein